MLDTAPVTNVLSVFNNCTVACVIGSFVSLSTSVPIICRSCVHATIDIIINASRVRSFRFICLVSFTFLIGLVVVSRAEIPYYM